jgi:hypothetical protein
MKERQAVNCRCREANKMEQNLYLALKAIREMANNCIFPNHFLLTNIRIRWSLKTVFCVGFKHNFSFGEILGCNTAH